MLQRSIKASQTVDQNTSIYYRLAQLYEELEDLQECKKFMMKCVDVEELLEGIVTDETVKARLWLAIFEIKAGNYQLAYDYAMGYLVERLKRLKRLVCWLRSAEGICSEVNIHIAIRTK